MMEGVLRDAFIKTDEEFSDSGLQAGLVGSTAVVALVGTHRVWIANCGELLCRTAWCMHACIQALHGVRRSAAWQALHGVALAFLSCMLPVRLRDV
jgi:hypothetical protein